MTSLPSIQGARLPGVYVEAVAALAKCQQVDECKNWADKAAALASYARQADDKTLLTTAVRIQARAIRRCGELLKAIDKHQGSRTDRLRAGSHPKLTRENAATNAGLSAHQRKDALRVASVPAELFERSVESPNPPTVTKLAKMGTKESAANAYLRAQKPPGFKDATHTLGMLERFAEFAAEAKPVLIAEAMAAHEKKAARANAMKVVRWLGKLIHELR